MVKKMKVKKLFEEIDRVKVFKGVKGFNPTDYKSNPKKWLELCSEYLNKANDFIKYLEERRKKYLSNDNELGEHGLTIERQNQYMTLKKINELKNNMEIVQGNIFNAREAAKKIVGTQKKLFDIPKRDWRNRI